MRDALLIVVEDSDDDFDTVCEALTQTGLRAQVQRALTGGDALDIVVAAPRTQSVVVMLDLNTPGVNGREALAAIKNDPRLRTVPVVVLTTSADPRDLSYCYGVGANAYHVKPLAYPDHRKLVADTLTYWLERVTLPQPTVENANA